MKKVPDPEDQKSTDPDPHPCLCLSLPIVFYEALYVRILYVGTLYS